MNTCTVTPWSIGGNMRHLVRCNNTPRTKPPRKPYTLSKVGWDRPVPYTCPLCGGSIAGV